MQSQNPSIQTLGVFLRPSTPELKSYFLEFQKIAKDCGFQVLLDSMSANMINLQGMDFETLCEQSDALISIGGDGTLISTARRSLGYGKPILGINMGHLGFLTDLCKHEVKPFLPSLKEGLYHLAEHMILEGHLQGEKTFYAINDILFTRLAHSGMIHIKAFIDENYFNSYYGDGLIIATPTGSTAYNISAGGAVVYPFSHNILLTPLCPHSLTQRPLILPSNFHLQIELATTGHCNLIVDGQENYFLKDHQPVKIQAKPKGIKLIHNPKWNYFKILKEKFNWGDFE